MFDKWSWPEVQKAESLPNLKTSKSDFCSWSEHATQNWSISFRFSMISGTKFWNQKRGEHWAEMRWEKNEKRCEKNEVERNWNENRDGRNQEKLLSFSGLRQIQ